MTVGLEQFANVIKRLNAEYKGFTRVELRPDTDKIAGIVVWHVKDYGFVCGDREEGIVIDIVGKEALKEAQGEFKFCDDMIEIIKFVDDFEYDED